MSLLSLSTSPASSSWPPLPSTCNRSTRCFNAARHRTARTFCAPTYRLPCDCPPRSSVRSASSGMAAASIVGPSPSQRRTSNGEALLFDSKRRQMCGTLPDYSVAHSPLPFTTPTTTTALRAAWLCLQEGSARCLVVMPTLECLVCCWSWPFVPLTLLPALSAASNAISPALFSLSLSFYFSLSLLLSRLLPSLCFCYHPCARHVTVGLIIMRINGRSSGCEK